MPITDTTAPDTHSSTTRSGYLALLRVAGLIDRVMLPYFGRFGISRSQWACLRILYRAEEEGVLGLRPADLGRRLLVRPPSITGLIERLRRLGYVKSSPSSEDLRSKEVCLSNSGRNLVKRILLGHSRQIASVMSGLNEGEQRKLQVLLQRLSEHLEKMAEGEGFGGI